MFFGTKFSKSCEFHHLKRGLHASFTDIVETVNSLIQERHNHSETCIPVKIRRRTKIMRFILQMYDVVLQSLKQTRGSFSVAMLALKMA